MSVLAAVGCGGSNDSATGGMQEVRAHWFYFGPQDDGGYNLAMQPGQTAMDNVEGATTTATFEVPYSQRATQIARQAVAQGSNVLVDTLGLADLMTSVCREDTDVYCFSFSDPKKPTRNIRPYYLPDWDLNYTAGVAAGLTTNTNEIGMVASYDVPLIRQAVNTFALGCQSVNPDCKTRVVYSENYFDPSKESQLAHTLIDAGADVLRNYVDSPTFCEVAADEDVFAVGNFWDFNQGCPDSNVVSTVWSFADYMTKQTEAIRDGTFHGGRRDLISLGDSNEVPHLGEFGDFVADSVRTRTEEVFSRAADGEHLIVGPIYDQDGQLRFKKGEVVPTTFMLSKWTWYVNGVIAQ